MSTFCLSNVCAPPPSHRALPGGWRNSTPLPLPVEAILSRIQVEKRIMNERRSHLLSLGLLHTKCQLSSFGKGVQMIADLLRRSQDPYA